MYTHIHIYIYINFPNMHCQNYAILLIQDIEKIRRYDKVMITEQSTPAKCLPQRAKSMSSSRAKPTHQTPHATQSAPTTPPAPTQSSSTTPGLQWKNSSRKISRLAAEKQEDLVVVNACHLHSINEGVTEEHSL